jgi:hypothetical protein
MKPYKHQKQKILNLFGLTYLRIHLFVTSWHPQQLICHFLKSKPEQTGSLTNNQHFIKGAHPNQTTGSKVTTINAVFIGNNTV